MAVRLWPTVLLRAHEAARTGFRTGLATCGSR